MTLSLCHTAIRKGVILFAEWLLFSLVINLPLQSSESMWHAGDKWNKLHLSQTATITAANFSTPITLSLFNSLFKARLCPPVWDGMTSKKKKKQLSSSLLSFHWREFVTGRIHFPVCQRTLHIISHCYCDTRHLSTFPTWKTPLQCWRAFRIQEWTTS